MSIEEAANREMDHLIETINDLTRKVTTLEADLVHANYWHHYCPKCNRIVECVNRTSPGPCGLPVMWFCAEHCREGGEVVQSRGVARFVVIDQLRALRILETLKVRA